MGIKYPNVAFFVISLTLAVVLSWIGVFEYLVHVGQFGYLGAFVSGLLLPFTFATPIASASFFHLGQAYNIWSIVVIGAIGTVFTDLFILKFFKGGLFVELEKIWENHKNNHPAGHRRFTKAHRPHLIQLFHIRPFHFITLFLGVIVLFSPLPDEIGLEMLGYYKLSPRKLIPLGFTSGVVAIWLVTSAGRLALG